MFDRLYHELAWAYDPVSWLVSGGRWRDWQRTALPYVAGPSVLEIGCGPGHLLGDLRAAGYAAFGVDRSWPMARRAGARLLRSGHAAVVQANGLALPFAAESFDSIVLTFPTPIIAHPGLWDQIWRVDRPGGRVVVVLGARSTARLRPRILKNVVAVVAMGKRSASQARSERSSRRAIEESGLLDLPDLEGSFTVQQITQLTPSGEVGLIAATKVSPQ